MYSRYISRSRYYCIVNIRWNRGNFLGKEWPSVIRVSDLQIDAGNLVVSKFNKSLATFGYIN
jgi:hypothetical protein